MDVASQGPQRAGARAGIKGDCAGVVTGEGRRDLPRATVGKLRVERDRFHSFRELHPTRAHRYPEAHIKMGLIVEDGLTSKIMSFTATATATSSKPELPQRRGKNLILSHGDLLRYHQRLFSSASCHHPAESLALKSTYRRTLSMLNTAVPINALSLLRCG